MFNKHIICLITHIAAAPLFTLCLKRPTAAPEKPSLLSLVRSLCCDWSTAYSCVGNVTNQLCLRAKLTTR